jgi:GNAT superfamily N-acetyltransferase
MTITDGYHEVPAGRIAAVVTYLEMRELPAGMDSALPAGLQCRHVKNPDLDWYRQLFRAVGEPWLWFSRVVMSDVELLAVINHPQMELYALEQGGKAKGVLELDFRAFPDVEISFFGLTQEWIGKGAGRFLIQLAIREAFRLQPQRLFLHTCTLDHPGALTFYRRAGFLPYKRAIEVAPDPRLNGIVPGSAAPQIPIL